MKIPTMINKMVKTMTYKELANKLGVTERSIYLWKNGAVPDYYTGKKLERMTQAND